MATLEKPGPVDCLAKLLPDEPFYLLMGRSRIAPLLVRMELITRQWEIRQGLRPDTPAEQAQIREGFACLTEMEIWGNAFRQKQDARALEYDDRGIPTTGPHARKERNTTSGANDG
jgi:hypothetical protein